MEQQKLGGYQVSEAAALGSSEYFKNVAETAYADAQAERERLLTKIDTIELQAKQRSYEWALASDVDHRVYWLDSEIKRSTVSEVYDFLSRCYRVAPAEPVRLILTSPGGDAWSGMALVDHMLALRQQGLYITVTVRGTAASMAAILLQAGTVRQMGPSSTLLVHKISSGMSGSLDQIEDWTKWLEIYQERQVDLFAERSTLSRAEIKRGMNRKDWSLSPAQALEAGFIDEIA
jgi:ATP-dependent protease ClpP protease subunit